MKILILGAGQVGSTAAYSLAREEANEVTIVDRNPEVLRELQDRLDIRTVVGNASHPDVLERAGGRDADMIIALTNSDEINMVACQIAFTLFRTPTRIARIRARALTSREQLFGPEGIPVDVAISPASLVTDYIEQLIRFPGALQVLDFADGRVRLVATRAHRGRRAGRTSAARAAEAHPERRVPRGRDLPGRPRHHPGRRHRRRGRRRGVLHRSAQGHPYGAQGNAQARRSRAQGGDRGRRQHRPRLAQRARGDEPSEGDRARLCSAHGRSRSS